MKSLGPVHPADGVSQICTCAMSFDCLGSVDIYKHPAGGGLRGGGFFFLFCGAWEETLVGLGRNTGGLSYSIRVCVDKP